MNGPVQISEDMTTVSYHPRGVLYQVPKVVQSNGNKQNTSQNESSSVQRKNKKMHNVEMLEKNSPKEGSPGTQQEFTREFADDTSSVVSEAPSTTPFVKPAKKNSALKFLKNVTNRGKKNKNDKFNNENGWDREVIIWSQPIG